MTTHPALGSLMVGLPAGPVPAHIQAALRDGLAGVILFGRNIDDAPQLRELTAAIRQLNPRALIGIDEEGGGAGHMIAAGAAAHVGNLALGELDDTELTRRAGYDMAGALAGFGINLDFAPCADVNTRPENPVIGVRSFGSDAFRVAAHVAAFTSGMQARGVAACVKHFPGHGDTVADSHLALPDGVPEITPFRGSGAAMMMTAHVLYPGLDDVPATLSHRILTGIARTELGYDGVIVTDALEMRAISDRFTFADAAFRAITAGADLVLIGLPPRAAELEAVLTAMSHAERITEAAARVSELAGRFGAPAEMPAPDGRADREAATRLARRQQPPALGPGAYVLELRAPDRGYRYGYAGLADLVRWRDRGAQGRVFDMPCVELDAALAALPSGRPLLVGAEDPFRLPWIGQALQRIRVRRPDAIVISTGLPVEGTLCAYGKSPVMLNALLDEMIGDPA
jgi:beta-N-acetylhexosaminidase